MDIANHIYDSIYIYIYINIVSTRYTIWCQNKMHDTIIRLLVIVISICCMQFYTYIKCTIKVYARPVIGINAYMYI